MENNYFCKKKKKKNNNKNRERNREDLTNVMERICWIISDFPSNLSIDSDFIFCECFEIVHSMKKKVYRKVENNSKLKNIPMAKEKNFAI